MTSSRPPTRRFLRDLLLLGISVGLVCSVCLNIQLEGLRRDFRNLQSDVGVLEIDDPAQVAIGWVLSPPELIPPGVEKAFVWRYRIYLPDNYDPYDRSITRLVSADSPAGAHQGSGWSNRSKAHEYVASVSLIHSDNGWMVRQQSRGMSSTTNLSGDFLIESLDDLIIEPIVTAENPTRSFTADEAICLLRIREKTPATDNDGKPLEDRYRGIAFYLHSAKRSDAFDAWAAGGADSMAEAIANP